MLGKFFHVIFAENLVLRSAVSEFRCSGQANSTRAYSAMVFAENFHHTRAVFLVMVKILQLNNIATYLAQTTSFIARLPNKK